MAMQESTRDPDASSEPGGTAPDRRRPYRKPELTEYGPVANLTQFMVTGSKLDGSGMMMTCL
jgi:hypothetical protein